MLPAVPIPEAQTMCRPPALDPSTTEEIPTMDAGAR